MSLPKGDFDDYLQHKDSFKRYLEDDEEIRNSIKSIEHAHEGLSEHHAELHDAFQAVKTYEQTHKKPRHHLHPASIEPVQREDGDFLEYDRLQYPFHEYLRHMDTIQSIKAAHQGISDQHMRLHTALQNVKEYEHERNRVRHTLYVKPALEHLQEEDPDFFTQDEWNKFHIFVETLCKDKPNWIGHVMAVYHVCPDQTLPVILCLEWLPDRENPQIRSWTGQVVVLARLVHSVDDPRISHWHNHHLALKQVDEDPFKTNPYPEECPFKIQEFERYSEWTPLSVIGMYYVDPATGCMCHGFSEDEDFNPEKESIYDERARHLRKDDAGYEARGEESPFRWGLDMEAPLPFQPHPPPRALKRRHEDASWHDTHYAAVLLARFKALDPSFFTEDEWTNFNTFVTMVCEKAPEWLGYVMHVDKIIQTPLVLCLQWRPEHEGSDVRCWTGEVVVLAGLNSDENTRSQHWVNHPFALKHLDPQPFLPSLHYAHAPVIIPGLSRFEPGRETTHLHDLGTYFINYDAIQGHAHLSQRLSPHLHSPEDEYGFAEHNLSNDDAGAEACG